MNFQKRLGTILVGFLLIGFLAHPISILNAQTQKPEITLANWLGGDNKSLLVAGYTIDAPSNNKKPYLAIQNTEDHSTIDLSSNLGEQIGSITAILQGTYLATGGEDGTVALWKWNSDKQHPSLQFITKLGSYHVPIDSFAWDMSGSFIAILARNQEISIWNIYNNDFHQIDHITTLKTGQIIWDEYDYIYNSGRPYSSKLSLLNAAGITAYKTTSDGTFDGVSEHELLPSSQVGDSSTIAKDLLLKQIAIVSPSDHKIEVFDSITYAPVRTIPLVSSPTSLVWDTDIILKPFAYADDKAIRIVNSITGYELANYPIGKPGSAKVIGWSSDASLLAFLDADNIVQVVTTPDINYIWDVKWSPDGKWIATGGWHSTSDGTSVQALFSIRNSTDMSLVLDFSTKLRATTKTIFSIDWSPDGKYLLSGSEDGKINVWAINDPQHQFGDLVAEFGNFDHSVVDVAWSPDGKWIASSVYDKEISIWNATNNDYHLIDNSIQISKVNRILWSPDSKWLTRLHSGCASITRISSTGTVMSDFRHSFFPKCDYDTVVTVAAWNPQSTQIALTAAFTNKLYLYDVPTSAIVRTMDTTTPAYPIVWSPDGTKLTYGTDDSLVHVINADTYGELTTYVSGEYNNANLRLAWRPDSTALAFVSGENKPYPKIVSVPDTRSDISTPATTPPP